MHPKSLLTLTALAAIFCAAACGDEHRGAARQPETGSVAETRWLFVDRTAETGLHFTHFNGMTGEYYFPEMMGGGGGVLDYDLDGDLDLYLVQGRMLGDAGVEDAAFPPRQGLPLTDRLFRNETPGGAAGAARLRFRDVTAEATLPPAGYGMGLAAGDYDGDGDPDLYVTAFGGNRLLRNRGDGTFEDVTAASGTGETRWSVPAVFFDFDRDGRPDLYVGNYLDYTLGTHRLCLDAAGRQDYCGPTAYGPVTDRLFRNRGDGTFEDVSAKSGIGLRPGRTLGALAEDLDGDGWPDLYVANDGERNFLWINQGDGTFRDDALLAGCALDKDGLPQAGMGVAAGDYDHDGDQDLFLTHLTAETNTLYRGDGGGFFTDATDAAGLGLPSWAYTSFGTGWVDFDRDGWLDLVTVSGAVHVIEELAEAGDPYPLHQRKQLYRNLEGRSFEEVSAHGGPAFELSEVGRGLAFGDLDDDGATDLLVVNNNGPARLLFGQAAEPARWVGVRLADGWRTAGTGLVVELRLAGRPPIHRSLPAGGSYAAASEPRLTVGLGAAARGAATLVVRGPLRREVRLHGLPLDRYYVFPAAQGGS